MDFFDKLGESLAMAGKDVTQKAKDVSEIAKLKLDIKSKEDYVQKQYMALGLAYYEKHKDEEGIEEAEQFFLIKEAMEEIERMKAEVLRIQGSAECRGNAEVRCEDAGGSDFLQQLRHEDGRYV